MLQLTNIRVFLLLLSCWALFIFAAAAQGRDCLWEEVGNNRQMPLCRIVQQPLQGDAAASAGRVQHWVKISAALIERQGDIYVQIYAEIDDDAARWGEIAANSVCLLYATDGKRPLRLRTLRGAAPAQAGTEEAGKLQYNCVFTCSRKQLRRLRRMEVGSIELSWQAAGRRTFLLYDVDALARMADCAEGIDTDYSGD